MLVVECGIDALRQPCTDIRTVVVADCIQEEVLQALLLKDLTQNVKNPSLEGFVDGFQLAEKAVKDLTLSGLFGHEVPQMADLLLTDTMNSSEPLLQTVRVPRKVIVDHQIRILKVHALSRCICG